MSKAWLRNNMQKLSGRYCVAFATELRITVGSTFKGETRDVRVLL